MKVVLLLSGGLDSGTLLSRLIAAGNEVHPISIRYGQRHVKEVIAAQRLLEFYSIKERWKVIDLSVTHMFDSSDPSTLINPTAKMPHLTYQEIATGVGPSPTYVPFRNSIFISIAVAHALQIGAEEVYLATHAEDARNWAYPDCTPEFNGPMAAAVYVGTYHKVRLRAPFQWMMKKDIVAQGVRDHAPFQYMWSCYEGEDKPCGKCPTCVERIQAFADTGIPDPALTSS